MKEFVEFPKIPRLKRECFVTEKIDGTNACIHISDDLSEFLCGSRTRWITPESDNYGFAKWALANKDELMQLGPGTHFGEWWGLGIQRGYGMPEKVFSLFNTGRWMKQNPPKCCRVVPILYVGVFNTDAVDNALATLKEHGSSAAPGFMRPEGVVVYQVAGRQYFKVTIEKDEQPKSQVTA